MELIMEVIKYHMSRMYRPEFEFLLLSEIDRFNIIHKFFISNLA